VAEFKRRRRRKRLQVKPAEIDYKNYELLKRFMNDKGGLKPARATGATAKLQRKIATAIKRARNMALLPYTVQKEKK
jgi:small subunit ribosomal protein S18